MNEDLSGLPLHQAIQTTINNLVADGVAPAEVAEAALTVAAAAKIKTDGLRDTARQLFIMAAGLSQLADRADAQATAPKH